MTFAGVPAQIANATATMIAAVTPTMPAGAAAVVVTTSAGMAKAAGTFWAYGPPSVAKTEPAFGPMKGGNPVVFQGPDVQFATSVMFGSKQATITVAGISASPGFQGQGILSVKAPVAASPGMVPIIITTPMGTVRLDNGYDYYGQPTITRISPSSGPVAGGNSVTIEGSWLQYAENVGFGGAGEAAILSRSANRLVVKAPPAPYLKPGAFDVSVRLAWASAVVVKGYTYIGPTPAPSTSSAAPATAVRMTAIAPNSGIYAGGDTVTITGTNLATARTVTFGSASAQITARTATTVTVVSPASPIVGPVTVTVVTAAGTASLPGGFTYWSPSL